MARKTRSAKPAAANSARARGRKAGGQHRERESHPWEINIPDHPQRRNSAAYLVSRKLMNRIVKGLKPFYLGDGPYQDHHGGGLWVKDEDGWILLKNLAGLEWSQQFCADPAKVDVLRQFAQRIYRRFPASLPGFKAMGFADVEAVLNEEIDDAAKVARWCDSIFNASVPLNQRRHTGVLDPQKSDGKAPRKPGLEGGVHHYPTPITDIQLFKRDDFQLWVADGENQLAAVVPVAPRGSKISRVRVAYATPGTKLGERLTKAVRARKALKLPGTHKMAEQAFAAQNAIDRRKEAAKAKLRARKRRRRAG
jgi:Family of unknown function (DUF6424)